MDKILKIIESNGRLSSEQIAVLAGLSEKEVSEKIKNYEKEKIIAGYSAIIDWEKTDKESVTALIEINVTPQKNMGFDNIAKEICSHKEVRSLYLMSGGFDLMAIVEGATLREVALFVSQKLAPIEAVSATATHFVLKRYIDKGIPFFENKDERGFTGI